MGRYLRISEEAEAELLEIIEERMAFDQASALALGREIFRKAHDLLDGTLVHAVVLEHDGTNHHAFYVKSVAVLYFFNDEYIEISRVFGPGRNWRDTFEG